MQIGASEFSSMLTKKWAQKAQMDEVSDSALAIVVIDQPRKATQSIGSRTECQSPLCDCQEKKEDHESNLICHRSALESVRVHIYIYIYIYIVWNC